MSDNQIKDENKTLISVNNLSKHFEDLHALNGVTIDINKGDVVFVIGPSGSGKLDALTDLRSLQVEQFFLKELTSQIKKQTSICIVKRWEWCSSSSIFSLI